MNNQPIKFRVGEENGIVVEEKDYVNSLFYDQYKAAFTLFQQIWDKQEDMTDGYGVDNQFSNIIAFCGDRGEGKSSCMSSFAKMLADEDCRKQAENAGIIDKGILPIDKIALVDTIDPAFFDREHNVLELLVGQLFANIKEDIKKMDNNPDGFKEDKSYLCKQLLDQFHKVKASMSILEKKDKLYDTLEEIDDLSAGIRLKKELDELFKLYLQYHQGKASDQLGRIVIRIDDIDLNMTEAYKMAELIRKYLIGKHCILLVAVKVAQLVDVVAGAMKAELKDTATPKTYCLEMAQKYVTKMLPQTMRVNMPSPADFCNREIIIFENEQTPLENDKKRVTLKEYIVRLIFQTTGYIFYNTQYLSPIIPLNLRELRHLIAALYDKPNARVSDTEDDETGREAFKDYFYHIWTRRLERNDRDFVLELENYDDLSSLNKFIVDYVATRVAKLLPELSKEDTLYADITKKNNIAANISAGDVLYVLWKVDKITMDSDIKNLIFWLKSYYSMRLFACYNRISVSEDTLYPASNETDVTIHKADKMYEHMNDYQRLVNGSLFTYDAASLLPKIASSNLTRDKRLIETKKIKELFEKLSSIISKKQESISLEDITILNLCEYIALCVGRTAYSDDKGDYRNIIYPTYCGPLSTTTQNLVFDFMLPFYSLSNVKYAYERFNDFLSEKVGAETLYSFALKQEKSLLSQMLQKVRSSEDANDDWGRMHHVISDAVLRMSDVQWAIMDILHFKKNIYKIGGDIANFNSAYAEIKKLNIKLYPIQTDATILDEKKGGWKIDFQFIDELMTVLKAIGDNLFNKYVISIENTKSQPLDGKRVIPAYLTSQKYPAKGEDITRTIAKKSKAKNTSGITMRSNRFLGKEKIYNSTDEVMTAYGSHLSDLMSTIQKAQKK